MENFNFRTMEKLPVLFVYRVGPKKFILTFIIGSQILSIFLIGYTHQLFSLHKNYLKYMILILEMFNSIITLFFLILLLRLSGISRLQCMRVISFNYYYQCFYIFLFYIYTFTFFI